METKTQQKAQATSQTRRDIHQQVTDTIIQQLKSGTVPWQKPWKGEDNSPFSIPKNFTTGNKYRGINILLLWSAALSHNYPTQDWASFKQWQKQKETIRKGEKGSTIVYYDTLEKETDGEIEKIPFIKTSVVFNRSQLAGYVSASSERQPFEHTIPKVEQFLINTNANIDHKDYGACYIGATDKIYMPYPDTFIDTGNRTKEEAYYSVLMHELTHWTGHRRRLDRKLGKNFGDQNYSMEELVAELGSAFLCAELEITQDTKTDHATYIDGWLKVLKENKKCIFTAASEASKACDYLNSLQVAKP